MGQGRATHWPPFLDNGWSAPLPGERGDVDARPPPPSPGPVNVPLNTFGSALTQSVTT
jgi:hypothetical protein